MPDEILVVKRMLSLEAIERAAIDFIDSNKYHMRREMGGEIVGELEDFGPSRVTLAWAEHEDDAFLYLELTASLQR